MRIRLLLIGAVLVAAVLAATLTSVWRDNGTSQAQASAAPTMYLFSQDAAGGSLTGPDELHLTLTLTGVRDWVTRFTDRPVHAAETVDIRDFLDRWPGRFGSSPPNAVLSFKVPDDPHPRDMVLELRNPRYSAAEASIVYDARRIRRHSDGLPGTRYPLKPVVYPIPHTFGPAALFIDDAKKTCCVVDM